MSIKQYYATKDNTIANTYKSYSATQRVSDLNFGQTQNLEIYSLYGTVTSSVADNEKSRVIVQFDTAQILADRNNAEIPASGSISFFLKLYNFPHTSTNPTSFTVVVSPLSRSWDEGNGKSFNDLTNKIGSNWNTASSDPEITWTTPGGDTRTTPIFEDSFTDGTSDLNLDVTSYVESIISDSIDDHGLLIQLTSSQEDASQSYYKKGFYSKQFGEQNKRPMLEAHWNNSLQDDSSNFFLSSSRLSSTDNLNTIYLYNQIRGNLVNIPSVGTGEILVSLYSGSSTTPSGAKLSMPAGGDVQTLGDTNITGTYVSTGVYSTSFSFTSSSLENVFAVWHSGSTEYHTSSVIEPTARSFTNQHRTNKYYLSITNLKEEYLQNQISRLRLFVRDPSLTPALYTVATTVLKPTIIEKAYYKIYRHRDNFEIISYGTGSSNEEYTRLSFDSKGNYFDLDFSSFAENETYVIRFMFLEDGQYREQPQKFQFKVVT